MARTRIIIGHPAQTGSQSPFVVYLGSSGSEAEAALKADRAAHHYEIFEGPGRRKNNSSYDPLAKPTAAATAPAAPITIPEDISGLKKPELQEALAAAIARIKQLEEAAAQKEQEQPQESTGDLGLDP